MKSIIPLSAITILTACALVGCNQSNPSGSAETPSSSSSMNHADGIMGGTTNMPSTNMLTGSMSTNSNTTGAANDATR